MVLDSYPKARTKRVSDLERIFSILTKAYYNVL